MSITLEEARATLTGSVLHTGATTFSTSQQDRAIRDACNDFITETDCNRTVTNISISSGTREFNPTSTITQFREDLYIDESTIGWEAVNLTTSKAIARRYQNSATGSSVQGRPELIGFRSNTEAWIYPEADAAYTLEFTHRELLTSWTIGTQDPGSVTLNIPVEWVGPILHLGAKYYMLYGASEAHPDSIGIWDKWQKKLMDAKAKFRPRTSGVEDRNVVPGAMTR